MKNSASNCSQVQALQRQAKRLLPEITATFLQLDYSEISHQRLSQEDSEQQRYCQTATAQTASIQGAVSQNLAYQGLTRAHHACFGAVMIKWQLAIADNNSYELAGLHHEAAVLEALQLSQHCSQHYLQTTSAIAPPLLAYKTSLIKLLEQCYRLSYLVLPYYPSGSLAQHLNNKQHSSLTDRKKQSFIFQAASIIAALHKQGWLHNDIKPSNILLDEAVLKRSFLSNDANDVDTNSTNTNSTKANIPIASLLLTDFALAQVINIDIDIDKSLYRQHNANIAGTRAYLAPERWQGQEATEQSDIYAFGVMSYEILTGKRPFTIAKQGCDPMLEWATQHCQQPVGVLPEPYRYYQLIIDKALAKQLQDRYQNMQEVIADLQLLANN